MNALLLTIVTMGISLVMDNLFALRVYKTLANLGYKPVIGEINKLPAHICYFPTFATIMPIYNIFCRMYLYMITYQTQSTTFELLKSHELICEMTEEEKKIYKKNPTGLRAYKLFKNIQDKEDKIQSIYMIIGNTENEIFYRIENKKMVIVKVEGPINEAGLSKEDIEGLIHYSWQCLFKSCIKLQGSKFFKEFRKYDSYQLQSDDINKNGIDEIQFHYKYKNIKETFEYLDNIEPSKEKVKTLGTIKKQ